ncbi:MAG: AmmeMemoRadiSam system protein A [Deltaproteobacteria bacterium]|nr:AmmeMemoRadiSam system protein A [Deltaproteobacteria bacterium]
MLTATEKKTLLRLAREAIEAQVSGRKPPLLEAEGEAYKSDSGAFVTIHKDGMLRGCIGTFASPNPLYKTIIDMAVSAAAKDPRFMPLTPPELSEITIEISVLSPLKEISDVSEVEVGRHGLYIIKGRSRGVLLPQVATENGFNRIQFLEQTSIKAGLNQDAWKQGATIFTFEAEIFREE